ncbi:MAG: 4-hydroxythreonine-4-phosphate dehydrogenase PdxA [Verrucomicrobiota bacterium]|jgi:4-hydroxythreonine-4-phosphate dehydrogenase
MQDKSTKKAWRPVIALSLGDAAGIGPELCIRAAISASLRRRLQPVLIGPAKAVAAAAKLWAPGAELAPWEGKSDAASRRVIRHVDCGELEEWPVGRADAACGRAGYEAVVRACRGVLAGEFDAMTTAPLSKEAVNLAGIAFCGHTELVAELSGSEDFVMMQSSKRHKLQVSFATCHMSLASAAAGLDAARIRRAALLLRQALQAGGISAPKLAACGLNPHAGEGGYLGREELDLVIPALEELRREGVDIAGPFPADTLFVPRIRERFDGIVAMYHDQGHIPFKMLAFDCGVNCTLGLPIIRTSPDHGTAYDIAWKGQAGTGSFFAALKMAADLAGQKRSQR